MKEDAGDPSFFNFFLEDLAEASVLIICNCSVLLLVAY